MNIVHMGDTDFTGYTFVEQPMGLTIMNQLNIYILIKPT